MAIYYKCYNNECIKNIISIPTNSIKKFQKKYFKKVIKMVLHSSKMLKHIYTYNNKNIFAIFAMVLIIYMKKIVLILK